VRNDSTRMPSRFSHMTTSRKNGVLPTPASPLTMIMALRAEATL